MAFANHDSWKNRYIKKSNTWAPSNILHMHWASLRSLSSLRTGDAGEGRGRGTCRMKSRRGKLACETVEIPIQFLWLQKNEEEFQNVVFFTKNWIGVLTVDVLYSFQSSTSFWFLVRQDDDVGENCEEGREWTDVETLHMKCESTDIWLTPLF